MGRYVLLLIGKSGNGKSSTGNSILAQKKAFVPRSGSHSTADDVKYATEFVGSDEITVVDGPGIGDASLDNFEGVQETINKTEEAIECSDGFDAILIILKYGERFTKQEKDSIRMMKGILGKDFIRTHGIVVFTYGDSFECDNEGSKFTFMDWCKEQTGDIKQIFKECEYRCLIFNNRADEAGADHQRRELFEIVDRLRQSNEGKKNGKYGIETYQKAKEDREEMLEVSSLPNLQQKHKEKINSFQTELDKEANDKGSLLRLKKQVEDYKKTLQEKKNQDLIKFLFTEIEITERSIDTKLKMIEANQQMSELQRERQKKKRPADREQSRGVNSDTLTIGNEPNLSNENTRSSSGNTRTSGQNNANKKFNSKSEASPSTQQLSEPTEAMSDNARHAQYGAVDGRKQKLTVAVKKKNQNSYCCSQ